MVLSWFTSGSGKLATCLGGSDIDSVASFDQSGYEKDLTAIHIFDRTGKRNTL